MKLLYLADIRFPMERANGIQTIETCHALARRGTEVELVVRRTDARSDEACLAFFGLDPHVNLSLKRLRAPGRLGFLASALPLLLRTERSDVVYTRDLMIADVATRIADAAVIYEAHTVAAVFAEERTKMYEGSQAPSSAKLARLEARERRVWRRASGIVTITAALRDALDERHGRAANTAVVPDACRSAETMPPLENASRICYIGQLYPWKGVDVLIRAMVDLKGVELVVVGGLPPEPDLDRARKLAQELSLLERVTFRGFVPPPELESERRKASIFVVPNLDSATSRLFTSPLKLFEAMSSGRPVVASDLPSIREVLTHERNALLVPPGDASALAVAIGRLLADRALAERLAARAFEDVKAYSWDRRAEAIETFARDIVGVA